jgi:hypothetical protein
MEVIVVGHLDRGLALELLFEVGSLFQNEFDQSARVLLHRHVERKLKKENQGSRLGEKILFGLGCWID